MMTIENVAGRTGFQCHFTRDVQQHRRAASHSDCCATIYRKAAEEFRVSDKPRWVPTEDRESNARSRAALLVAVAPLRGLADEEIHRGTVTERGRRHLGVK